MNYVPLNVENNQTNVFEYRQPIEQNKHINVFNNYYLSETVRGFRIGKIFSILMVCPEHCKKTRTRYQLYDWSTAEIKNNVMFVSGLFYSRNNSNRL